MNEFFVSHHFFSKLFMVRLFILAAGKLDKDRQKAVLFRLIELLQIGVVESAATLPLEIQSIRLLARGVCLAAHAVRSSV